MMQIAAALILGLLLGSIPFGLLVTGVAGLGDVRKIGSGSIGATNVLRTGRKGLAAATLLLDGAKGAAAVFAGEAIAPGLGWPAGLAAVLGHCYSIWLRGKGGKGVATGLGVFLAAAWPAGVLCCAVWLLLAKISKRSSVASLGALVVGAAVAPLLTDPFGARVALVIALVIWLRHYSNIQRLFAGAEPRIGEGK